MFEILQNLLSKNEIAKLEDTLIITVPNGYELFGEYLIYKEENRYSVTKYNTDLCEYFYSLQNATIYATLYKRNKVVEAKRMLELDILLESANADIIRYKTHGKDFETRIIASAKFEEARHRRFTVSNEIKNYLFEAKMWQEGRYREAVK